MEQNINMGTPTPPEENIIPKAETINTAAQTPASEEKGSTGPVISIVVIVLVLAFGAFYFLKQVPLADNSTLTPAEIQADQAISTLSTQGTSIDLTDIEKDLNATDLSGLDAGLADIVI